MDNHEQPSKQELAALELYHQLVNLSPDNGDIALRLTLRLPNGAYVGDVLLSQGDVERLADAAMAMGFLSEAEPAAAPLPVDEAEIAGIADEVQAFLQNGGQ